MLTPGRYIEFKESEQDDQAFQEAMTQLTKALKEQMTEAGKLDDEIKKNLKNIGFDL